MQYIIKHFSELTTEELLEIYKLRVSVFVVEAEVPLDQEVDDADRDFLIHIWFQDEDGIQAYARVMDGGVTFAEPSIGRIIAKKRAVRTGQQNRFQRHSACTGAVSCKTNQDCCTDLCHSIL